MTPARLDEIAERLAKGLHIADEEIHWLLARLKAAEAVCEAAMEIRWQILAIELDKALTTWQQTRDG